MPDMITGTAGVSPVQLLHPDPETARHDSGLRDAGWVASGRDLLGPPAVFAVELDSSHAAVRGVVAVWDVTDPPASGGLLPHEETDARGVRRRVKALRSAHVDRDPLLLTHRGGGAVSALVAGRTTPVYEMTERDRHVRVHQVSPEVTDDVVALLTGRPYLVADGHHRLAAAVQLRREGVAAQVTALVVDADTEPLSLGPIHRVLLDLHGRDRVPEDVVSGVLERCRAAGAVVDPTGHDPQGAVRLLHGDRSWTVTWPAHPRSDVTTLVDHVLQDTARCRTRREPQADMATASGRSGALAVLLPAPDLDAVLALSRRGALMPYKATAFEPKLPSGALVRPLAGWQPSPLPED